LGIVKTSRTYLDYNATAPVRAEVAGVVADVLANVGNASSVHTEGQAARGRIEAARSQVAQLVGAAPKDIIFTSGGTEAINLAIQGLAKIGTVSRILVSGVEHPCVLAAANATGLPVEIVAVTTDGAVELAALEANLAKPDAGPALVCVMLANNETGCVQPVAQAAKIAHGHESFILVDAVQAAGKINVDFAALGADMMALSAHKIGGVIGTGGLVVRDGLELAPLITGGGQEQGRRGGTENIAGIAGFGTAADAAYSDLSKMAELGVLRDRLEEELAIISPDHVIFAKAVERLPNTSCFAHAGIAAETSLIALDLDGIAVSSGSACSSGKVSISPVLTAMGVEQELARGALRVSLGHGSTKQDVDRFITAWKKILARHNKSAAA